MPIDKPDLGAAVAAAYGDDDAGTAEAEAEVVDTDTTDDSEVAQAQLESESGEGNESEAQEEASSEGTDDLPDRYFEVERGDLPAEEWRAVIAALKERDDEIGKLLRGRAEDDGQGEEEANASDEPAAPEALTDDAILKALGLDPENPFEETASKVAVPLVRAVQGLQQQVEALLERDELAQLDAYWTAELDALEASNGELPIERVAVLEFAAENGIQKPADAYWRIAGPAKRQVEQAVAAAQARVKTAGPLTKQAVAGTRPKSSDAEGEVETRGKGVGKAVEAEAAKVLKDLGLA